jgi:hypothetical protein
MPISGLVITLHEDPDARAAAMARLAEDPRLTLGRPVAERLPVVAESRSAGEGAALVEELGQHAGVVRVDVVSIDFEDDGDELDGEEAV